MKKSFRTKKVILIILISVISFTLFFGSFFCAINIYFPKKYQTEINLYSQKYNIEPVLIFSLIKTESNFNKDAISSKGAVGLMQIMPSTAIFIADELKFNNFTVDDLLIPKINIEFGVYYLNYLIKKFENIDTAICAYNAGETIVKKWLLDENYSVDTLSLTNIPYPETYNYLKKVKIYSKFYQFLT